MKSFAEYILSEKDYIKKHEKVYYFAQKENLFYDNSVILKTELARQFIETMKLKVDEDLTLTACMLYNCKKSKKGVSTVKVQSFTKESAKYLEIAGFPKRLCKICEEAKRTSEQVNREPESDILELVDNFGDMLLTRPDRRAFPIDEALLLLEKRSLKGKDNQYLDAFKEFIFIKEGVVNEL